MILFQIGHLPIFSHLNEFESDLGMISDLSWELPTVDFRLGGTINLGNRDANYNVPTVTVSGDIIGSDDYPISLVRKELEVLGGQKHIPFIAFELIDDFYGNNPALVWYVCFGSIATYSRNFSLRSSNAIDTLPVSLTLVLETPWKALNSTYWKYVQSGIEYNYPLTSVSGEAPLMGKDIKESWIFYYLSPTDEADYYDITELITQGTSLNRYALNYTALSGLPSQLTINTTPYVWNTFPTTLYFFKNLPTSNTDITLSVSQYRPYSSEVMISEDSVFNCQELNTLMAVKGYTGLLTTDIVVLGNVRYFPGFVIRGGTILSDVKINASFPGNSFGQLYTETNKISVDSAVSTIQFAMYTTFNRI